MFFFSEVVSNFFRCQQKDLITKVIELEKRPNCDRFFFLWPIFFTGIMNVSTISNGTWYNQTFLENGNLEGETGKFLFALHSTGCPRKIDTIKIGRSYNRGRTMAKSQWQKRRLIFWLLKSYISFWLTLSIFEKLDFSIPWFETPFPHPFYD